MANQIYPLFLQACLDGESNIDLKDGNVKITLLSASYVYSPFHQYRTHLTGVVATSGDLQGKSVVNGFFKAADITYPGVAGAEIVAFAVWLDTGTASTSRLVAYIDSNQVALPLVPTGGDIKQQFDPAGIFAL